MVESNENNCPNDVATVADIRRHDSVIVMGTPQQRFSTMVRRLTKDVIHIDDVSSQALRDGEVSGTRVVAFLYKDSKISFSEVLALAGHVLSPGGLFTLIAPSDIAEGMVGALETELPQARIWRAATENGVAVMSDLCGSSWWQVGAIPEEKVHYAAN